MDNLIFIDGISQFCRIVCVVGCDQVSVGHTQGLQELGHDGAGVLGEGQVVLHQQILKN